MKRRTEPAVLITATFTPEQAQFVKGLGRLGLSRLVGEVMAGELVPVPTRKRWWKVFR